MKTKNLKSLIQNKQKVISREIGYPSELTGKDGDFQVRKIIGQGIFLFYKWGSKWYSSRLSTYKPKNQENKKPVKIPIGVSPSSIGELTLEKSGKLSILKDKSKKLNILGVDKNNIADRDTPVYFKRADTVGMGTDESKDPTFLIENTGHAHLRFYSPSNVYDQFLSFGRRHPETFTTNAWCMGLDSSTNVFRLMYRSTGGTSASDHGVMSNVTPSAGDTYEQLSVTSNGVLRLGLIQNAGTDTDKFLVSDNANNGYVKFRTGANVLADIGGQAAGNYITGTGSLSIQDLTDIGNLSGTNTGDNATNSQYSGLVTNATHTGDVTGSTTLTIANDVALGGSPTTTTQSAGNNSTKIATTEFVSTAVSNLVDSSPDALNTLNELAAALGDDADFSTTVTNSIATKAPLASPTFTGTIAIPNIANLETAVSNNTSKVTNVSTALSVGTNNTTQLSITSDGGADDVTLPVATTSLTGVINSAMFDKLDGISGTNTGDQTKASFDLDHLYTLVGAASDDAEHLGTFTGSTISDSQTIKQSLQALETAVESAGGGASALNDLSDVTYSSGDLTISSLDKIITSGDLYFDAGGDITLDADGGDVTIVDTSPSSAKPSFQITSTEATTFGPIINFYHNSASPSDTDYISMQNSTGKNDAGQDVVYMSDNLILSDVADGEERAYFQKSLMTHGSSRNAIKFSPQSDNTVDTDIGYGAASSTTIAGNLTITGGNITNALTLDSTLTVSTIAEVGSDTDKFLMSDSGVIKYVTGADLRTYIGAGTSNLALGTSGTTALAGDTTIPSLDTSGNANAHLVFACGSNGNIKFGDGTTDDIAYVDVSNHEFRLKESTGYSSLKQDAGNTVITGSKTTGTGAIKFFSDGTIYHNANLGTHEFYSGGGNAAAKQAEITNPTNPTFSLLNIGTGVAGISLTTTAIGGANTFTAASGNLTLDVAGDIELNADGGNITFKDAGVDLAEISTSGILSKTVIYFDAETATAISNGATGAINWTVNQKQKVTITGTNITCNFTNPPGPCNLTLKVVQGDGSDVIANWDGDIKWPSGNAPTLSTGNGAIDILSFYWDGTNYYGVASLNFS